MQRILPTIVIAFIVSGVLSPEIVQAQEDRPNILLIVGDDIGFGDLGISGSVTRTPNLDRLAERGTFFTNFHVSPVCSVTRSMLLTGNDPIEIGLGAFDYAIYPPAAGKPGYEGYLTRNAAMISEVLQDAGYHTCQVGKWHLGGPGHGGHGPEEWGFDRSYGIYTGGANHWNQHPFHVNMNDPEVAAKLERGELPLEPYHENGKPVKRPIGIYSDTLWTNKLMEQLEEAREADKPFFAYVAYTTAHVPLQAPDFLVEKYFEHYLELGFEGVHRARFEAQKKLGIIPKDAPYPERAANPLLRAWENLDDEEKRRQAMAMATYSAMMESQDYHIGMLLNYLHETGELDNTLIIYTPDNGPEGTDVQGKQSNPAVVKFVRSFFSQDFGDIHRGNSMTLLGTDWAGAANGSLQWWKWYIGEGGIRVPMIVVPPKNTQFKRAGEVTNAYAYAKELPVTILDYAGVEHPQTSFKGRDITPPSGVSLRPFLGGEEPSPRSEDEWVAFELFGNAYIVAGDYKAIRVRPGMFGDGEWHLYDIVKDPGETRPLEGEQPERLKKMLDIYKNWAKEKGIVPVADDWSPWGSL